MHNYDFICFSETCLDSATPIDSNDLSLKSYNLYRVVDPENDKNDWSVFIIKKP